MLEEAVASLQATAARTPGTDHWSPQIAIGAPVMIPEDLRAGLAASHDALSPPRRTDDAADIDAFGAELIDRFGPMPEEVEHLLKVLLIKALCRERQCREDRRRSARRGYHIAQQHVSRIRRGWSAGSASREALPNCGPTRRLSSSAIGIAPRAAAGRCGGADVPVGPSRASRRKSCGVMAGSA